tara:strand:- start:1964 stop:2239 length:276 start_codon:yes stop_codon:yes gene_type:complete
MKDLKPYPELKYKHYQEVKTLLSTYSNRTIQDAGNLLGIDPNNLRTLAFRVGVTFQKSYSGGTTRIDERKKKPQITLTVEPWMIERDRGEA